jgi:hypothetical protein
LVLEDGNETNEIEQDVEDAGLLGGHALVILFFAAFEGFTVVWLVCVFQMGMGDGLSTVIMPMFFGYMFHLATQWGLWQFDPGNVHAALESLEEGVDDKVTASIFEDLRRTPPTVRLTAEAYHETRSGSRNTTHTVVDHTAQDEFRYGSWKDVSGSVAGLDNHAVAVVEVVAMIKCADTATTESLEKLMEGLKDECRKAAPGRSVRSGQRIVLEHPTYEVDGSRVFATRSPGAEHAGWMKASIYTKCRFAFPFLGTIYRLIFFKSMAHVRYKVIKEISTTSQVYSGAQRMFQQFFKP